MEQNLTLYHIFNAVAESGNISKAARKLYISQPAISKAISRLEQNLNTQLFVRNSRGVTLTDSGKSLYEHTSIAFNHLMKAEENLARNQALGIGHIKFGVSTTLCKYILLPYLKEFTALYPHVRITISCQSTYQTVAMLQNHKVDIGLIGKPGHNDSLAFDSLGQIDDVFIATPEYIQRLTEREQLPDLNTGSYAHEFFPYANLMLLDSDNISRRHIDNYFHENDIEPDQVLEVTSMDLLIEFAKTGLGIACVIDRFVKDELESGQLISLPLKEPIPGREIGFAYVHDYPRSEALEHFIEFYKESK